MTAPEQAARDPARLAALDGYGILDTPAEQGFDDIVLLASRICGTPVALVSLVAGTANGSRPASASTRARPRCRNRSARMPSDSRACWSSPT